jgi:hypothetical protein
MGTGVFDDLFARERAGMVRLAYLICGSADRAEEVTHDAFVRLYLQWDRTDRPSTELRRTVVDGAVTAAGQRDGAAPGGDPALAALRRLPPRIRAVVVLRDYAGVPAARIADIIELPPGTVPPRPDPRLAARLARAADDAGLRVPALGAVRADADRRTRSRQLRILGGVAAAVVLVAAVVAGLATRGDDAPEAAADPEPSSTSIDPAPVASTAAPTTAPATTPPADQLALRPEGIGAYDFGAPAGEVIAAVTDLRGAPSIPSNPLETVGCLDAAGMAVAGDEGADAPTAELPPSAGTGLYMDDVQWSELRLGFAGPDADSLVFTGWLTRSSDPQQNPSSGAGVICVAGD